MRPRRGAVLLTAGILAVLSQAACERGGRPRGISRPGGPEGALPLLTADEVALVDGVPIKLTSLERVRDSLGSASVETVFWVTIAAAVLDADARRRGHPLSIREAVAIARFSIGRPEDDAIVRKARDYFAGNSDKPAPEKISPAEVKAHLDRLVETAEIKKNAPILSNLKYK